MTVTPTRFPMVLTYKLIRVTHDSQFRRNHGAISLNESFQENTFGAKVMNQIECFGKTKASALSLL